MPKLKDFSLYLVLSSEYSLQKSLLDIVREAIDGGVDVVQMREKKMPHDELVSLGFALKDCCHKKRVLFIVNDDPVLAHEINADGVHLGQEDMIHFSIPATRRILGKNKIIGVSTHSLEQFKHAHDLDVDYIAFGPLFSTQTKSYAIGTKDLPEVMRVAQKPVVCIGGIGQTNIKEVLDLGVRNIAVIRQIMQADDCECAARDLKNALLERLLHGENKD
jgi:thiamine-phosphate pyrophosphorylase